MTGATIHRLWKSHVEDGEVVSDLDDDRYARVKTQVLEVSKYKCRIYIQLGMPN